MARSNMSTTMDPPSRPASRALQNLSPERVNSKQRPNSVMSTSDIRVPKTSDFEAQFLEGIATTSTPSSPSRSPVRKANLFADYKTAKSPTGSGFGGQPLASPLAEIPSFRASHNRTNSDVQGLVKRFEHLDVRDRDAEGSEWRKKQEAELRRAQIAREEAESDVRRLREENRRLKRDLDEGRDREMKITKRIDVISSESHNAKEAHAAQVSVYEKEVRKSRKEAFKCSSALVKLQEELRATRSSLRITQSGFDLEKQKVQKKEQETFSAQYQLVALQQELDGVKTQLQTVEEEREALKTSLKEEEVARIAAEGMIALPTNKDDDEFNSPQKSPQKRNISPLSDDKENIHASPKKLVENRRLEEELAREQTRREHAEEMIEFLRMECSFRCCSRRPNRVSMSPDIADVLMNLRKEMDELLSPIPGAQEGETMDVDVRSAEVEREPAVEVEEPEVADILEADAPEDAPEDQEQESQQEQQQEHFHQQEDVELEAVSSPKPTEVEHHDHDMEVVQSPKAAEPEQCDQEMDEPEPAAQPPQPDSPQTPPYSSHKAIRTVTTTTTVPIQFTPVAKPQHAPVFDDAEHIPQSAFKASSDGSAPVIDRAAALAAIQYRRGRAKSIANGHMTPRKQMLEGIKERRDISAPNLGAKTNVITPAAKGSASVGRAAGRRMV